MSKSPEMPTRPGLFQMGDFTLHSGDKSSFKIDCDALTDDDITTLAHLAIARLGARYWRSVTGVPSGGLRFAAAIDALVEKDADRDDLIVDDVLTTGASMQAYYRHGVMGSRSRGAGIFARGKCPWWIKPLFVVA